MAEKLAKGARISGNVRDKLATDLKKYEGARASGTSLARPAAPTVRAPVAVRVRCRVARPWWCDPGQEEEVLTHGVPADLLDRGGLRLSVQAPIARVTLARPQARNAQTPATWRALTAVGAALGPDVVVLDEGPSFSAGLDRRMLDGTGVEEASLADLAALDAPALDRTLAGFQAAFTWWRRSSAVTVAAVAGHAVGAGFQLALACDLIVCAEDAQFAMREVSLGLVPDLGGTGRLVAAVGSARALEICGTGAGSVRARRSTSWPSPPYPRATRRRWTT